MLVIACRYAASHEAMWTTQNYIRLAFLALQVITFSYKYVRHSVMLFLFGSNALSDCLDVLAPCHF